MPGFNSFLFGHGHFTNLQQTTPPQSDDECDSESSKKRHIQHQRRRNRQVSSIYGTNMSHKDAEHIVNMLKHLKSDIDAQVEVFYDIGLATTTNRKEMAKDFSERNQLIIKGGAAILQRFGAVEGPIEEFSKGFMELGRLTVALEQKKQTVDMTVMHDVVVVYQRQLKKLLGEMTRQVAKILSKKEAWKDPR